jgi:transposase
VLAHFADAIRPEVRQISDESSRQLEDLVARRRQISDMITAEKNRRRGKTNSVQASIDQHIEWLKQQLKEIESHPRQLLYEGNPQDRTVSQIKFEIALNEDWKRKMKVREGEVASPSLITLLNLLTSVPGIGEVVAVTLISSLPELGQISHKSISYLVGVAPLNRDSPNTPIRGQAASHMASFEANAEFGVGESKFEAAFVWEYSYTKRAVLYVVHGCFGGSSF